MVRLQELFDMRNGSLLRNRAAAACWNAAKTIFTEDEGTPLHAERMVWAVAVLRDKGEGPAVDQIFRAVMTLLQDNFDDATDEQVQGAVNGVINAFAAAGV